MISCCLCCSADLIFILLDRPDEDRDQMISEHIMGCDNVDSSKHLPQDRRAMGARKRSWADSEAEGNVAAEKGEELTLLQRLRALASRQQAAQAPP